MTPRRRAGAAIFAALATTLSSVALGAAVTAGPAAADSGSVTIAMRDDFNVDGQPNQDIWMYTLGTSYPGGPANFGTGEEEINTDKPENVRVTGGNLAITPTRVDGQWYSARIESREVYKPAAGQIMRTSARLQFPNVTGERAKGYWPAFWMLGGSYRADRWSWPSIGELDIAENVNGHNWTFQVLHCGYAAQWGGPCNEPSGIATGPVPCEGTTCQGGFHEYAVEWDRTGSQDVLRWYLDGKKTLEVKQADLPADVWASMTQHAGYYVILNVAMSGAFPVAIDGNATPATEPGHPMLVDWVEVKYLGSAGSVTPTPTPTTPSPTPTSPSPTPSPTTPPTTPPSTTPVPLNLRVGAVTSTSITLKYDVTPGARYQVVRGGIPLAYPTPTSGDTLVDSGLLPGLPYMEGVKVTYADGRTEIVNLPDAIVTGSGGTTTPPAPTPTPTPTPTTPPSTTPVPLNLRVAAVTSTSITLKYDVTAGARYQVVRGGVPLAYPTATSGDTLVDSGLMPGLPYLEGVKVTYADGTTATVNLPDPVYTTR